MGSSWSNKAPRFITRNEFWLKRLHSLSGILPIGGYLLFHLFQNSYAQYGPARYNELIESLQGVPYRLILELGVIAAPILYHILYGFAIIRWGSPNVGSYPYIENWKYLLQRLTGLVAFLYIGVHVYRTTLQEYLFHREVDFELIANDLSNPFYYLFSAISIVCIAFHFGNGLWSFLITWGITRGERSQKVSGVICAGVFIFIAIWGNHILYQFLKE